MYQLDEKKRNATIGQIAELVPEPERTRVKQETGELSDMFEGQDINVMGVLWRAAEKGRFHEFAGKIRDYHTSHGNGASTKGRKDVYAKDIETLRKLLTQVERKNVNPNFPPELFNLTKYPEAMREELFFSDCYEDLKPFSE